MKRMTLLFLLFGPACLAADLPDWASQELAGLDLSQAPADASVWIVLDETQIVLKSNGKLDQRRRLIKCVLRDRDADDAGLFMVDGDEKATRIKKLLGWHRRADGKVDKLDKDNVVTAGRSTSGQITSGTGTLALFERVRKGSTVVFESNEVVDSYFALNTLSLLSEYPVRRRVVRLVDEAGGKEKVIVPLQFEAWKIKHELGDGTLLVQDLPGLEYERLAPDFPDPYPRVLVGFLGDRAGEPLASWDNMAKWYFALFVDKAWQGQKKETGPAADLAVLKQAADDFRERISYRQRYLTAARGWEPAAGAEVERLAFGDCKDMVACFSWKMMQAGVTVLPVLANIADGPHTDETVPPQPAFNHLIGAVKLTKTMGLPAEIEADGARYLLFDPTDRYTRLGYLHAGFAGRHLLICRPDGASWVAVPDSALESEAIDLTLRGEMDPNFTFKGSLVVVEKGDGYGLRTTHRESNEREVAWRLRDSLDLPGVVDLVKKDLKLDADGSLTLTYDVTWPSFLYRDAGGLRLPKSVVGYSLAKMRKAKGVRTQPLASERRPVVTWHLDLGSAVQLATERPQAAWQGDHHAFTWHAQIGDRVNITFERSNQGFYYPLDKLEEGLTYWTAYREKFNDFWLNATLLYPQ